MGELISILHRLRMRRQWECRTFIASSFEGA